MRLTQAVDVAVANAVNCVVGFGGGSALDLGKAVAALVANGGEPLDYLEVVGAGKKLTKPSLPYIAVPTTAGARAQAAHTFACPNRVYLSQGRARR